jgi:hypothetical protein
LYNFDVIQRGLIGEDGMTYARNRRTTSPRLVPTGNVDEVLLTGKSGSRDLTRFQAIGLAGLGLFVAICGVSTIAYQFTGQSQRFWARTGISYGKDYSSIAWGIGLSLLGGMWAVMGLIGVAKGVRRREKNL